jgi:hypothetical protein
MNAFLITMQYKEDFFLPVFLKHYLRYFKPENIFIIDHGSATNLVPSGVNRIFIPRDRPPSEKSRLQSIKSISSALLNYYEMGVYADCDELISFEGIDLFSLKEDATYVAGFEVFFDEESRLLGLFNPNECKPLIFKKVPEWELGFHTSESEPKTLILPMAHTRYLYREISKKRMEGRKVIYQTLDQTESREGVSLHWSNGELDFHAFHEHIAAAVKENMILKSFAPMDPLQAFDIFHPENLCVGDTISIHPKGDWQIQKENFYMLSEHFPDIVN